MKSQRGVLGASFVFSLAILAPPVQANPEGGTVTAGAARFDRLPGRLTINQGSERVIINWRSFSIGAGEVTKFVQPSATSAALNRVMSGDPSRIYGNLEANGRVFLINPNGVMVGKGATINTRGFVASTLDVSDASFLSGAKLTLSGDSTAAVVNEGAIEAIGGDVFLIGRTVENSGTIRAASGTVGLAAGSEVVIVPTGRERVSVIAGNADGAPAGTGVKNLGTIEAVSAELKAAGGNIYALAINNGGIVRATGVERRGGRVFLTSDGGNIENSGTISAQNANGSGGTVVLAGGDNAENPSTVINSGTLLARGEAEGTQGGEVRLTGNHVGLFGASLIDVSGHSGGGVALIGGDYQGANSRIQNAQRTSVGPDAVIRADALARGNGGKVVVWSDEITRYHGTILARGGLAGGNGGFAEVSGKSYLSFYGKADLSAPAGLAGSLLLDPQDVTIQDTGTDDGLLSGSLVDFAEPDTTTDITLSDDAIEGLLGTITIRAHRNLFINEALTLSNQGEGESVTFQAGGDLEVNAAVTTGGASLSFIASDAGGLNLATATLTIDAAVSTGDITGTDITSPAHISLVNDGTGGIAINAAVETGDVTITDNNSSQTGRTGDITITSGGPLTLAASGSLRTGTVNWTGADGGADNSISGKIDITTAGASAAVTLDGSVITGNATVGNENGADSAVSGNITVSAGGSISGLGALTTGNAEALENADNGDQGDTATSGSISLTAGALASLLVDNILTTGTAKVRDSQSDNDVATTGGITLQAGVNVTGSGRLVTGAATLRGDATSGTDSANSGSIQVTAGSGGVSGGIGLSAANALTTGDAIRIDASSADLNSDTRATGDITLNSRDEVNNGTVSTPLSVLIGSATLSAADEGAVNITPTVPGGDVFVTSSPVLRVGTVTAGAGDVTLVADEIDFVDGNDSVAGTATLTLRPATAAANVVLGGVADSGAPLDLIDTDLDALADGFSSIVIGDAANGSGAVTVAGPAVFNDNVTLVGGSIFLDDTLTSSGNTATLIARTGSITEDIDATADVVAATLSATAQTGINLDTTITTLALAQVNGTGAIDVSDTAGGLAVTSATTTDGNVTLNATGGDLSVTAATAGGAADIELSTTTSGDVVVGLVTAAGDQVTINAAGAVTDGNGATENVVADALSATAGGGVGIDLDTMIATLTLATASGNGDIRIDDLAGDLSVESVTASGDSVTLTSAGAITDANGGTVNVTAEDLSATAQSGIDLDTDLTTLTLARVLAAGAIDISDASGLTVTDAQTFDGNITLAAAGNLTVTAATAGTGIPANAGNGNVQLTTTSGGDVDLGVVTATADGVTINAAGAVTDGNGGAVNVIADSLSATAQSGIDLDSTIATLTLANVVGTGNINISDSADGLTVTSASTGTGGDVILAAAGGLLDVVSATAGGNGDIQLTTTGSGNVNVGVLTAADDTVTINSAGGITDGNAGAVNVTAGNLSATAQTGIDLDTDITTLTLASVIAAGAIDISDASGLTVTDAQTFNGNITLAAAGLLTVNSATAGTDVPANAGNGNIQLTTTAGGDVGVGAVTATADGVTINAAGAVTDANGGAVNVVADTLSATAQSGINLDTTITTLTLANVLGSGDINVSDSAGGLTVTSASTATDGNVILEAAGGTLDVVSATAGGSGDIQLTTTGGANVNVGLLTADGDTVTINSSGAITDGNAAAANVVAANLSATAQTGIDLDTTIATLTLASVLGVGGINVADTAGGLIVTAATTSDGNIFLSASGGDLNVTTATASGIGNIQISTTGTGGNVAVGNVTADGDSITISSAGNVTDSQTDATADLTANIISVTAGGNIGTAANPLGIGGSVGNVDLTASSGAVHVNAQSAGTPDVNITDAAGNASILRTGFQQGGRTYTSIYANSAAGDFTIQSGGDITANAGFAPASAGTLTLRAAGEIGGGFTAPLRIDAVTFSASAGTGLAVEDNNDLTLGAVSTTGGDFFIRAGDTLTLNNTTTLSAGAGNVILVADGAPGISVSGTPMINSRFLIYAVNATLTDPPVIVNQQGEPAIGGLVADELDSPRDFDPTNPDPFGDTSDYFVFRAEANPPTDPSLFIDIPMELYRPVSINFGEYDPTKFGEVGDLWMSSSELYEIERKAGKAPKAVPEKIDKSKYVAESK